MGNFQPRQWEQRLSRFAPRRNSAVLCLLVGLASAAGCHHVQPVDTKLLDGAGMSYDAVHELQSQEITTPEVASVATARQSGFPDADCIEVFKIYRSHNQPFDAGDAIAGLVRAGVSDDTVRELARLNQLGLGVGELQAIKLAGLSDEIIVEVARHHSEGTPVLAGASLAALRNAGLRESTLLELTKRGVPDSQSANIVAVRKHGATDAEILSRFTGA
jgi:hypothetical protein